MLPNDPLSDGEAQPRAAGVALVGGVGTKETLEDVRQGFRSNADTTVRDA